MGHMALRTRHASRHASRQTEVSRQAQVTAVSAGRSTATGTCSPPQRRLALQCAVTAVPAGRSLRSLRVCPFTLPSNLAAILSRPAHSAVSSMIIITVQLNTSLSLPLSLYHRMSLY